MMLPIPSYIGVVSVHWFISRRKTLLETKKAKNNIFKSSIMQKADNVERKNKV